MSGEVHALPRFYASPLGRVAARLVGARMAALWPDCTGLDMLGLGWAGPYMAAWAGQAGRRVLLTPADLGPAPPGTAAAEEDRLPLPDSSFDRILLVHGLEISETGRALLRECWRVLRDDGRLMVVVPNRLGSWALFDHTPFGQGRPYSRGQLQRLLEQQLFRMRRREAALFVPPFPSGTLLRGAGVWDRAGRRFVRRLAGVTLIEAEKDMLAAIPAGRVPLRRRVVVPVPARFAAAKRETTAAP
ncbi:methyltransferase domain-containing protein [Roseococcus sp. YIM B11640]|uniref:methyltransferase domain-containing protein n=1 Tax=Roseococcus sp. YIM B11640 TaxID=3133973 RepID=UPI003C7A2ACA